MRTLFEKSAHLCAGFLPIIFWVLALTVSEPGAQAQEGGHDINTPAKRGEIRLLYLSDPKGYIDLVPCNPEDGQGLLGVARVLEKEEEEGRSFLFFMTGDIFPTTKKNSDTYQSRLNASLEEYLPKLYGSMKVTAVVPGISDLLKGLDRLKEEFSGSGLQPVCANLVRGEEKSPVFQPYMMRELNGYRIGILGLIGQRVMHLEEAEDSAELSPQKSNTIPLIDLLQEKDCEVLEPAVVARTTASELRKKGADLIVAISYLSKKRGREVLESTAVDVVLGCDICQKNVYRFLKGGIRANTEHLVRKLGFLEFVFSGKDTGLLGNRSKLENFEAELKEAQGKYDGLVARYGTDDLNKLKRLAAGTEDVLRFKKVKKRMSELKLRIEELRRTCIDNYFYHHYLPVPGFFNQEKGSSGELLALYLDTQRKAIEGFEETIREEASALVDKEIYVTDPGSCRTCHPRQYEFWGGTAHASAFASALDIGCGHNLKCIRCHSTGYRLDKGFFLPPPPEKFRSINCEVCHGFLGRHLDDFIEPTQATTDQNTAPLKTLCVHCHDKQHSPGFHGEDYISRISCPPIDHSNAVIQKVYQERDNEFSKIIAEQGKLKNANEYVKAAIIKRRLGMDRDTIIELLYEGFALNPNNIDLIKFLFPMLIKENRPEEALKVLETYIVDNLRDASINLEIIRLLVMFPNPDVNDPATGREYIFWYLENLDPKNIEVYILLATADLQLIRSGHNLVDEAWTAIERAEQLKPTPTQREMIRQIREELKRYGGK